MSGEKFDVLDAQGNKTGVARPRGEVHALGLYHRAVHTWLYSISTGELCLQKRAECKDSWPGRWDISSAGHLSAGDESLPAAIRELEEELGLIFPADEFEYLFTHLEMLDSVQKGKPFLNHEFNDVYLVTIRPALRAQLDPSNFIIRHDTTRDPATDVNDCNCNTRWLLQASEVSAVTWLPWKTVYQMYKDNDPSIVPSSDLSSYKRLFEHLEKVDAEVVANRDARGRPVNVGGDAE